MKTLLAFLISLFCIAAPAQQIVTATVTVTGATVNGNTIVVNGSTRLFTNNVTAFASQALIGGTIPAAASNLWFSYLVSKATSITVSTNGTTMVVFKGDPGAANVITIGGGWGTVAFSTNTITPATVVRVPKSVEGAITTTNVANGLVGWLNDASVTNPIAILAPSMSNYVSRSQGNLISGDNIITGRNNYSNVNSLYIGGIVSNVYITNITGISGTGGVLTNLHLVNATATNFQNYGTAIRSQGGGTASEQFGYLSTAATNNASAFGNTATANGIQSTAIGSGANASGQGAVALGVGPIVLTNAQSGIAIGSLAEVDAPFSVAIGDSSLATGTNSMAIGASAFANKNHQIVLGTGAEYVSIPGGMQVTGGTTNLHLIGTNTIDGRLAFLRKDNTGLANGINIALNISTNTFVRLTGPSGAWSLAGIAGGSDGQEVKLYNKSGQALTITNNGVDPTPANRILTLTGADLTNVNFIVLIYDSAQSLWIVEYYH